MLLGALDEAGRWRIRGWVRNPAFPDVPVMLLVSAGDQLLDRMVANRHRPDLEKAGYGTGRFGFELDFNPPLSPVRPWTIHIRSEIEGYEVPGSPFRIEPSSAFDDAAQDAFAASIAAFASPEDLDRRITFLVAQQDRLFRMRADVRASPHGLEGTGKRGRRRALFIDERLPEPDIDAGSAAVLSHMRSVQRLGMEVSFACPALAGGPRAAALEEEGITCCTTPWFASIEELLRQETGVYDLVYLHRVSMAAAYVLLVRQHQPRARVVYSVADLYHVRLARQAEMEGRPELRAEALQIQTQEVWAASMADAVITHSSYEAQVLARYVPASKVHTVAWSVAVRPGPVEFGDRTGVAFIGNYHHAPNLDAARRLRDEIMPAVQRADRSIRCSLVGVGLPASMQAATAGTRYLGHVPHLPDLFDRVRLTVAPLAFGAGLKGKVLESLAAGVPCVCSPVAAEGLDLPERLARLVVPDTGRLVAEIVRLHSSETHNTRMGRSGMAYVGKAYSEARLDGLLRAVLGEAPAVPKRRAGHAGVTTPATAPAV